MAHIEEAAVHNRCLEAQQRWYAIKLFERDEQGAWSSSAISPRTRWLPHRGLTSRPLETELDDDAESIITAERYAYIADGISRHCYQKKGRGPAVRLG